MEKETRTFKLYHNNGKTIISKVPKAIRRKRKRMLDKLRKAKIARKKFEQQTIIEVKVCQKDPKIDSEIARSAPS